MAEWDLKSGGPWLKSYTLPLSELSSPFMIIIKFPYNARSDWLKQRALLENRARVNGKLAFKFLLWNFDKFEPN